VWRKKKIKHFGHASLIAGVFFIILTWRGYWGRFVKAVRGGRKTHKNDKKPGRFMEKRELSWAEVKEMFAEASSAAAEASRAAAEANRAAAEANRQIAETDSKFATRAAEADRQMAETDSEFATRAAEADRQMAEVRRAIAENSRQMAEARIEFDRNLAASSAKFDREHAKLRVDIENTNKNINGIADSNGMFAQEYFFNALEKKLVFAGVHFDYADDTLGGRRKKRGSPTVQDQFDIVLINEEAVAVIEVKHRARTTDVDTLIDRKLKNFKYLYTSTYGNHKVYLGIAAMIFESGVAEAAKKHGVGLLRQVGETVEDEGGWEVRAY
jgi:hypothetical protein